jgi:hypothetical protein
LQTNLDVARDVFYDGVRVIGVDELFSTLARIMSDIAFAAQAVASRGMSIRGMAPLRVS